ncbi:ADP-ribose pyrophosphatase [Skermanella stibiiresistens SB22]|uniref:ADP-ribose pyrophosphatase n=1 Tax=Skermanella stibiiresistens SB22 TaxID=1385369 RepID=W9H7N2_9PROT|nr:NUDIX domain-containing protein [Skermanella stibiiresistens]EWY42235.1 ADP-ribose pyrophosphatase [Skermanella stibiiresistens SB22]
MRSSDMMDDERDIEISGKETLHDGFFKMELYRLRHRKFDGAWTEEVSREIFERGNSVAALLYDPDADAVVMVEQFRLPAYLAGRPAWSVETPAGVVKPGEELADVARREAFEETGCEIVGDLRRISAFMASIGGSTEIVTLFLGIVDSSKASGIHGLEDEHEDIRVHVVSALEAIRRSDEGEIDNAASIIALNWLARNRDGLRRG